MVGSAVVRRLQKESVTILAPTRQELNLLDAQAVNAFYAQQSPDIVVLAAAKVGGIHANNSYPAEFITENIKMQSHVIEGAWRFSSKKLLFLGSSCVYPKECPQPIKEDYLMRGPLEPTNEGYAIAKIAGIKMCQAYRRQYGCDFISLMPTNLYGPNDNFHPQNSHMPAALLARFHEARMKKLKKVTVWGTGKPLREFLHVDDLADACVFLLEHYSQAMPINVGTGKDIPVGRMAELIKDTVGFEGEMTFDTSYPDGTYQKKLDVTQLHALGWRHKIELQEGLKMYYEWYLQEGN